MRSRVYYRIELELRSPLSIGASDSALTDTDVVLDGRGKPLLPATSLAGVLRSAFDERRAIQVFGEVLESERVRVLGGTFPEYAESSVRVYDGTWAGGNYTVTVRDNVALKGRVPVEGLKFDRQAVERGARFVTYLEVVDTGRCSCEELEYALALLHNGALRLGAKSSRGMGAVSVVSCLKRSFEPEDVEDWLEFDQFADAKSASWANAEDVTQKVRRHKGSCGVEIELGLALRGAISIREYTTEPAADNEPAPDYGQMIAHGIRDDEGGEIPIIPGTSWAGAFRERFESFAGGGATKSLFGHVDTEGTKEVGHASHISFSESIVSGGEWVTFTRNAIDRFTGGTISGALYTERAYYGGSTELVVRVDSLDALDSSSVKFLMATLADLHNGFLAVGGLASVGRGLFSIESARLTVDGAEVQNFQELLMGDTVTSGDLAVPKLDLLVDALKPGREVSGNV